MAAPPQDRNIGKVLQGRYRIVERLAHGGMGVVYKGERLQLERAVAVKFLHPWIASDESARRRFETEMRAMSRLTNPHCVSVIDFGVDESPYLVMDYVIGRTVRDLLGDGAVPPGRALHIIRQVLAGLAHAHGQGIIHRDIKPENIILAETTGFGDQVRILDFGLAKLVGGGANPTTGLPLGTPQYMSPEQTRAEPIDARTDLYAVAIVLHELLTGKRPFQADELFAIIRMQREDPPPPLGPGFSAELQAVVTKALAKAPGARFHSAKELAAALEAVPEASQKPVAGAIDLKAVEAPPAAVASVPPTRAAAARSPSNRNVVIGVVVACVAILAITYVAIAMRGRWAASPAVPAPAEAEAEGDPQADPGVEVGMPKPVPRAPAPAPSVPGEEPGELDAIRALPREAAIDRLTAYRKAHPRDAAAALVLGHLYFDKLWWNDGLAAYQAAIAADPAAKSDETMIRDLLKSLVSDNFHRRAENFLADEVGAPALPYVREAAQLTRNKNIKARAQRLLSRMD